MVGVLLFVLGVLGVILNRRNSIIMIMSIELMLLAVTFNMAIFSIILDDVGGLVFAIIILTVAAAESAIGLSILMVYYRIRVILSLELIDRDLSGKSDSETKTGCLLK